MGLYNISKHQIVGPEVAGTEVAGTARFRASQKPPLSVFGPHTKVSLSHGGELDSWSLYILSHLRISYIQVLCVVFSSTLCVSVFISCSLAVSHTSTDPQVMTSDWDNKKLEKDHRMRRDGSFILLMQGLSQQSLFTKGMQVQFLLLNESAFYTKSLEQVPMSHQLALAQADVSLKRAPCAKSKQKRFDFHVISPCCWSNGLARAGWWWVWWCQSKRAQSGFGGVQSEEGGGEARG